MGRWLGKVEDEKALEGRGVVSIETAMGLAGLLESQKNTRESWKLRRNNIVIVREMYHIVGKSHFCRAANSLTHALTHYSRPPVGLLLGRNLGKPALLPSDKATDCGANWRLMAR